MLSNSYFKINEKSGISPFQNTVAYLGGSAIIANHLSDFIKSVSLISDIGKEIEIKKLLNGKLKKNINNFEIHISKRLENDKDFHYF